MSTGGGGYLLAGGAAGLERLQLQARVWEPEAGRCSIGSVSRPAPMHRPRLRRNGHSPAAQPARRTIGPRRGRRFGCKAARGCARVLKEAGLSNVEILGLDAYRTALPAQAFDLVHVRFVFVPAGRDNELLREMLRLVRPGGVIAIQKPDASSWTCLPPRPSWDRLKKAILEAFALGGGDFNAGRRLYAMLRVAGLKDVSLRAAVQALLGGHPYLRLPVQFATSLRGRILDANLMSSSELDEAVPECERIAVDPEISGLTFTVVQAWGRAPAA